MLSTKTLLTALALALHVAALPSAQLKRDDDCSAEYVELVLHGECVGGHGTCEFCCPPGYDPTAVVGHCHPGHAPYHCADGYTEWHCDDH